MKTDNYYFILSLVIYFAFISTSIAMGQTDKAKSEKVSVDTSKIEVGYGADRHSRHPGSIKVLILKKLIDFYRADSVFENEQLKTATYVPFNKDQKRLMGDSIVINYYNDGDSVVEVVCNERGGTMNCATNYYYRNGLLLMRSHSEFSGGISYYTYLNTGRFDETWWDRGADKVMDGYSKYEYCNNDCYYIKKYTIKGANEKRFRQVDFYDSTNYYARTLEYVPDNPCSGKYYK